MFLPLLLPLESSVGVHLHDMRLRAQEGLRWTVGIVYYPLWLLCAFAYGLSPLEVPCKEMIDSVTVKSGSFAHLQALAGDQQDDDDHDDGPKKSARSPGRDKAIKSLLRIASLDRDYIAEVVHGENDMFAEKLKFTDHIVSYSDRREWSTSFHALALMMSAKIVEVEDIRDEQDLSVVNVKMCWLTPFEWINEKVGGFEFSNVMVVQFDESNRVCQIDEFWNGRDHLDGMGVFDVMRRVTSIATLPMMQIISCFAKRGKQTEDDHEE